MGSLFSKKKKPTRVTEQDKAVLQLKQQRDKLREYQKKLTLQMERDRQVAKQLVAEGKKDRAKLMLRKKRFQESLLEKTDGQLDNIERMVHDIEFAQIESQVINGLKSGNQALKKMHELLSLEDVEKIMDETQEGIEYQQEIDDLLSGGLSSQDEEDVLEELAQLTGVEEEEMVADLPEVPTDELPEVVAEKERRRAEKQKERESAQKEAVLAS